MTREEEIEAELNTEPSDADYKLGFRHGAKWADATNAEKIRKLEANLFRSIVLLNEALCIVNEYAPGFSMWLDATKKHLANIEAANES